MAHTSINGMQARRMATYGRTAGVVMLVCAASLWALQIPGMHELPAKPEPGSGMLPAVPQPEAAPVAKVDADGVAGMSERLDLAVVHAPKPAAPEGSKIEEPPPPEGPVWEYLGPIFAGTRSLAIVSVDGTQKILSEGRLFGSTKLMKIADDEIEVEIGKATKTIRRKDRDPSQSVSWMRNMQNNAPVAGTGLPAAGQPVAGRGNLPPEVQARLAERGITPQQMEQWRQGRDGRGGGQGRAGNNGGGGGGGGGNALNGTRQRATPADGASDAQSETDANTSRSRRRN